MFLIWGQIMQRLQAHDADDATEYICLLKMDVDEFSGAIFNVRDGLPNVADLQFGRKRDYTIDSFASKAIAGRKSHDLLGSASSCC